MKKSISLVVPVLASLGIGYLCALIKEDGLTTWYPSLDKSWVTPPNEAFPIAWAIAHACLVLHKF